MMEAVEAVDPLEAPRRGKWAEPMDVQGLKRCHFYHSFDLEVER